MIKHLNFIFFFLVLTVNSLFSQNYFYRNFSVNEGLSQSIVFSLLQDNFGNIWIGTIGGGIDVYNGNSFTNIGKDKGLPSNSIHHIMQDHQQHFWIATDNGIANISPSKTMVYTTKEGLPGNNVWCTMQDKKGNIWAATDAGLAILKNNRFFIPSALKALNKINIYTLFEDSKNRIWIGTNNEGIYYYNGQTLTPLLDSLKQPFKTWTFTFNEDEQGNIFIGTSHNAYLYRNSKVESLLTVSTVTSSVVSHGKIYFTLYFNKLYSYKDGKTTFEKLLPITNIRSLLIDKEDNIWIGSENGLLQYPQTPFYYYDENLPEKTIFSIERGTSEKSIWVGLKSMGAAFVDISNPIEIKINPLESYGTWLGQHQNKSSQYFKGIIGAWVLSILNDNEGKTWFGTLTGITVFNPKDSSFWHLVNNKEVKVKNKNYLPSFNAVVFHLSKDEQGNIWVATNKGLYIFSDTSLQKNPPELTNLSQSIYYILHDNNGIKWLCTNEGLAKYTPHGSLTFFNKKNGFTDGQVTCIIKDKYQHYWLATKEGIFDYDGKTFRQISKKDGLNSDNVYIIGLNKHQNLLFVGTNKGLNKIDLNSYYQNDSLIIKSYSNKEGFYGQECNRNAFYLDESGLAYFGTVNGITVYNQQEDKINTVKPVLKITDMLYNFQPFDWTPYCDSLNIETGLPVNLSLPYNKNHITFKFLAVSLQNPEKVRYQFKMQGLDDNWSPVLSKNETDFPSLPPGKYSFLIRACNNDGVWCNPVSYDFIIRPPFYKTWWFIVSSIILAILIIIFYINYRERALIREKERLESIVKERTAEVVMQKEIVEQKNKDITDSINYARNIQEALLPTSDEVKQYFPDYFIFYHPRDIVSGDFYWIMHRNQCTFFAVADCTGHGVPGAFMSMLGITFLDEIVSNKPDLPANEILNSLRSEIIVSLKQNQGTSKDGMDMVLIVYHHDTSLLEFAGANNPVYLIRNHELTEYTADNMPIGQHVNTDSFSNHSIQIQNQDMIYLFSDGYADQFGGPHGKKFKYKSLKNLLLTNCNKSSEEQLNAVREQFFSWKGDNFQVDDILVCGIRFNI